MTFNSVQGDPILENSGVTLALPLVTQGNSGVLTSDFSVGEFVGLASNPVS